MRMFDTIVAEDRVAPEEPDILAGLPQSTTPRRQRKEVVMLKVSRVNGRPAVCVPGHPGANNRGYVLRARYVMGQHLGRELGTGEDVHHKNGDVEDDRIENLEIMSRSAHTTHHWRGDNPPRLRTLDYQKIAELYEGGLGYKRIAKRLGYVRESVRDAVHSMKRKGEI